MADFEMPLEELYEYKGTNPKPEDFDVFWASALDELRERDPDVIFQPAEFGAPFCECFDLWYTGADGARIHAQYLRPYRPENDTWTENGGNGHGEAKSREAGEGTKKVEADPESGEERALLLFHGYSGDAGPWVEKLAYVAAGFHVFALDCRGQAGYSKDKGGHSGNTLNGHLIRGLSDGPENLYYRHVFLDAVRLADIAMALPEIGADRISVMGASQGGGLALAVASLVPEMEKAVVVYPFLSDYKRVWDMDPEETAYREIREYFRMYDPLHERENEIFTHLGYIDVHHLCPRIRAKVLCAVGGSDMVCPPSSQFASYNAIESEKKLLYYPDFGHEELRGFSDRAFEFLLV